MRQTEVEFDELRAALIAFEQLLPIELPADMTAFGQARVRLARSVNQFVAGERGRIEDLAALGVANADQDEQRALFSHLTQLRSRYSAHITRWSGRDLILSWHAYRRDSIELVAAMRAFLDQRTAARSTINARKAFLAVA